MLSKSLREIILARLKQIAHMILMSLKKSIRWTMFDSGERKGEDNMIGFIIGVFVGAILGVVIMALLSAGSDD